MEVAVDPAELLAGFDHAGGAPAQRHLPVAPVFDVAGVVAADGDHRLDRVGGAQGPGEGGWYAEAEHGQGFGHSFAQAGGGAGVGLVEFGGQGLEQLARDLDKAHPGAAASLREDLAETLTVGRLGVPPTLARTLRSSNAIESMIEICRDHATNVKRWRDGTMALRWCAAGMGEAAKQFRRVNGHLHLPALRVALDAQFATTDTTTERTRSAA